MTDEATIIQEGRILPTRTCFDDALEYLARRLNEMSRPAFDQLMAEGGLVLVHGICIIPLDSPEAGERFAHAWVEERRDDGSTVVWQDGFLECAGELNGQRITYAITREEFQRELQPQRFTRYSPREAWEENRRTGHFGPWLPEYRLLCGRKK